MKEKNKVQKNTKNVKRSNSVQKKTSKNIKKIVEMPPIPSSKINEQIDFASYL